MTEKNYQHHDFIESITNNSDETMSRVRIKFQSGLTLSVIHGENSYGGMEGLFEIAIIDKSGNLNSSYYDKEDQGDDDVLGYCTKEKVLHYINKIGGTSWKL